MRQNLSVLTIFLVTLQVLTTVLRKCLDLADKRQFSSIAFPLLGTGALGFPTAVVFDLFFDTIKAFGGDTPNSSLETVRIVISPDEQTSIKVVY